MGLKSFNSCDPGKLVIRAKKVELTSLVRKELYCTSRKTSIISLLIMCQNILNNMAGKPLDP